MTSWRGTAGEVRAGSQPGNIAPNPVHGGERAEERKQQFDDVARHHPLMAARRGALITPNALDVRPQAMFPRQEVTLCLHAHPQS